MSIWDKDDNEPIGKTEAIREVLGWAQTIEGEWGSGDDHRAYDEGRKILLALGVREQEIPPLVRSIYGGWAVQGSPLAVKSPMSARAKHEAMCAGTEVRDGYGKPMTINSRGEWVNEFGDTPCPRDGEMVNKRCWACGWVRNG